MKQSRHSNLSPRIQASEEGIARTNLPPRSRTSQDPKQSTLQITPFDTMPTGMPLRRALSNTTASERQYTLSLRLNALVLCVSHFSYSYGSNWQRGMPAQEARARKLCGKHNAPSRGLPSPYYLAQAHPLMIIICLVIMCWKLQNWKIGSKYMPYCFVPSGKFRVTIFTVDVVRNRRLRRWWVRISLSSLAFVCVRSV